MAHTPDQAIGKTLNTVTWDAIDMTKANAQLLLVEDGPEITTLLQFDLEGAGYTVRRASSIVEGLTLAREHPPDLVLLDLDLPDGDGRAVLTRLRSNSDVPIIVLTARAMVSEKVKLLLLGADDYVVKPCALPELLVRIAVQLRPAHEERLQLGELEVWVHQRQVSYQGQELSVSPTEFVLLALLLEEPGRVYSRQEIIETLWPEGAGPLANHVIDGHVANLRAKLRPVGAGGLIRTVRGYGFSLKENVGASGLAS